MPRTASWLLGWPLLALLLLAPPRAAASDVKGAVALDRVTFDKLVGTPHFDVLVKFDKSYPYGDKEDAFKEFVKNIGEAPGLSEFLVATVLVEDYGDKKNDDLRERFGVKSDDFPVYKLFPRGSLEPIPYAGEVAATQLLRFVKQTLGVWIGLPGCLERYDRLAEGFLSLTPAEQRGRAAEARTLLAAEPEGDDRTTAELYVQSMEAVAEKGAAALHAAKEAAEAEADAARKQQKQNVLASFTKYRCKSGHAGCLRDMDRLASAFLTADAAQQAALYAEAQALPYTDAEDRESAAVYLACFKRILEKGVAYVATEKARVQKLLGSQVSDNKKQQLKFKLVLLGSFEE